MFIRSHIAVAVALVSLLLVGPSAALAEPVLNLKGRVGVGFDAINNIDNRASGGGGKGYLFRGGGNQWGTSLLEISGSHDVDMTVAGGSLKALFLLESGFDAVRGATNGPHLWNRRAYAGLQSESLGTLTFGKNILLCNNVWFVDPFYLQFMSSAALVRGRNWHMLDNMVEYHTPRIGGFAAEVQYGLGGEVANFDAYNVLAVAANYTDENVAIHGYYNARRDENGDFSNVYLYSEEVMLGAVVHAGPVDLYAGYNGSFAGDADKGAEANGYATDTVQQGWLGAHFWLTKAFRLQAAGYHVETNDEGNATLLVLGTTYNFTDDFFAYASVGTVLNSDEATFSVTATDNRPMAGESQVGSYIGFMYQFNSGNLVD